MRVLVVEHHRKPSIGVIGEALCELGVETQTLWGGCGEALPAGHREYDGLVVLGGAMNALEDDKRPYFPGLTRWVREFAEADKPVLGVCLGAQLIARSFDADLHLGGELEFGFHPVVPTAATATDPVLGHLERPQSLFQWHTDHYSLPAEAELLATGDRYRNQAYRIGRTIYGMQFHFEVTERVVQEQIADDPEFDRQVPDHGAWLPAQFAAHEAASNAFCRALTRRWAGLAA